MHIIHRAAAFSVAALVLVPVAVFAAWPYGGGTPLGTHLVEGVGAISDDPAELPGVVWQVELPPSAFTVDAFHDIDGDGQVEMLSIHQGGVAAFDLITGDLRWRSAGRSLSRIVGLYDIDGDGVVSEIVATGHELGGGIQVIDAGTGSQLWSFNDLAAGSGVNTLEVALHDIDGDGAVELAFLAHMIGSAELVVADLSGFGASRVVRLELGGSYRIATAPAWGDLDGDGGADELAVFQFSDVDFFDVCEPASPDATCSDDGTLCVCHVDLAEGVFPLGTFPRPLRTVPGAAGDDLVSVHASAGNSDGMAVLDVGPVFATSDLPGGWLHHYPEDDGQRTVVLAPTGPVSLRGSGSELLVSVLNARTNEVGLDGNPSDDGLEAPGAWVTALIDTATGVALATLPDTYTHGLADLDGDGVSEIVVETTDGDQFSGGHVQGWELDCSADPCVFVEAWSDTTARLTRFASVYDGGGAPSHSLHILGAGTRLLTWTDEDLHVREFDGAAGLTSLGSVALAEEEAIAGVGADVVVVRSDDNTQVRDEDLALLADLGPAPSGAAARWFAAPASLADVRAVPILDGHVFLSELTPSELADADTELLESVALVQDVDDDGLNDVFSWGEDLVTGDMLLARHEFDGAGGISEQWTWSATGVAEAEGYSPIQEWAFVVADFDGVGADDIAFQANRGRFGALITLSGDDGSLLNLAPLSCCETYSQPLLARDLAGPAGLGDLDGLLDIVQLDRRYLRVFANGSSTPLVEHVLDPAVQIAAAYGDFDGDGALEVVTGSLGQTLDTTLEVFELEPSVSLNWRLEPLPELPSGASQAIAVMDLDGVVGDDILLASADSLIWAASGVDGSTITGFPIVLAAGEQHTEPPGAREPVTAVILADLDGDGLAEAIVGSRAGWVYGVDVDIDEPSLGLQWSFYVGGAVDRLALADIDGDGFLELLASTQDGVARVIDGTGVAINLVSPASTDCVAGVSTPASGTSAGITSVELWVQGVRVVEGIVPDGDGNWAGELPVPLVAGLVQVEAHGLVGDQTVVIDTLQIASHADQDDDGVTLCGGDCDDQDATRAPTLPEVCDEGVDNDCDETTLENEDLDGDGFGACDGDCRPEDANVHPDAEEVCDDGIDNDCDLAIDLDDTECEPQSDDDDATAAADDDDSASLPPAGEGCGGCAGCADGPQCSMQDGGSWDAGLALFGALALVGRRRRRGVPGR
jgi:MYXO-CTERM domain-containing protein